MNRRQMLPWALSGLLAIALYSAIGHRAGSSPEVQTAPVLQRMRALGELHTARFEYSDVVDHGTYQKPEGLLASFPGADAVARATTENKALIDVRGSVEAGVNMKMMSAEQTPAGLRITLPKPHLYPTQVDARLFSVKRGLFWRDESITLGAVAEAKARLTSAARQQGIVDSARREAETQVRSLATTFGAKVAEVRFEDAS